MACDGDDALGCTILAELYARGDGVVQDADMASELRRRACELGHEEACQDAADGLE